MNFFFVCPRHDRTFETDAFTVTENRGVCTDRTGRRFLDAKVCLKEPCPFCGERHAYRPDEIACPFESDG